MDSLQTTTHMDVNFIWWITTYTVNYFRNQSITRSQSFWMNILLPSGRRSMTISLSSLENAICSRPQETSLQTWMNRALTPRLTLFVLIINIKKQNTKSITWKDYAIPSFKIEWKETEKPHHCFQTNNNIFRKYTETLTEIITLKNPTSQQNTTRIQL